jgi:DNA-binding PadR family transcriptional regulator
MLLVLVQGRRHGYALKEELYRRTKGALDLGPGTLYRTIRRLLEDGLIEETDDPRSPRRHDERRRYYRITELGKRVVAAEAERLAALVEVAREENLISTVRKS